MELHGDSMEFHVLSMEFHSIPWNSIQFYGIPWNSMEFHGIPWNSMEFHGVISHGLLSESMLYFLLPRSLIVFYNYVQVETFPF